MPQRQIAGPSLAGTLAEWAVQLVPTAGDLELAERALLDTMAVTLAARQHPLAGVAGGLGDAARWASIGHVLDFDDLHLASTAHVSVVCVPTVLAAGGHARAWLAAAGVMSRLGTALGWDHYASGWHATCTAGAPAAAVGAGLSLGLDAAGIAQAIALAVPAAGGVQRAFGSQAKSLQVGFAAQAGLTAARLVAAGASADPGALDQWLCLVGGDAERLSLAGPAVPGGLAIKLFPCCYALQRPIAAMRLLLEDEPLPCERVDRVVVRTPRSAVQPLPHHRPSTGLEGKFSLEYAIAATLLDGYPGFESFSDAAVNRPAARELIERVEVVTDPGGDGLLAGAVRIELLAGGSTRTAQLDTPPGAPARPPSDEDLREKLASCGDDVPGLLAGLTWPGAARVLREHLPARPADRRGARGAVGDVA
jgi:2-methylcitrate dehydratase PrpD